MRIADRIVDCGVRIADRIVDCGVRIADRIVDCGVRIADRIVDCGLRVADRIVDWAAIAAVASVNPSLIDFFMEGVYALFSAAHYRKFRNDLPSALSICSGIQMDLRLRACDAWTQRNLSDGRNGSAWT